MIQSRNLNQVEDLFRVYSFLIVLKCLAVHDPVHVGVTDQMITTIDWS
jgi:hypothetical protein